MNAAAQRARSQAAAAQRPAADPAASVWVGASAGTGKTKVLTDRVLSLMLHGTAPSRILCLTFTKAAAAEMANRLAGRLARWAVIRDADLGDELFDILGRRADPDMQARARELFARVLDAPGGMKIQTIHAFCQSLLARFPLEAGIAPHFQVLDERSAAEMLREAREAALADPALAGDVSEVSVHAQEQSLAELLAELVRERGRIARLMANGFDAAEAAIYQVLGVDIEDTRDALLEAACRDSSFDLKGLQLSAQSMNDNGTKTDRLHGSKIASWLEAPDRRIEKFDEYIGAFFTEDGKGSRFKTLVYKSALDAAPGIDQVLDAEATRLIALREKLNSLTVARATAALLRLGQAVLDTYAKQKEARALLDYDDLIFGARDLLAREGAASWVLFKLDGGLDHILIDEAQDTNPEQWEVVERISAEFFSGEGAREGPRTVFAVGDAKQSIYSFQRADPAAFTRMREFFSLRVRDAGQAWAKIDLAHSFRSSAAILLAVDAVFGQETAHDGLLFEEAAISHRAVRLGQAGLVELWPPAPADPEEEPAPWAAPVSRQGAMPARARLARTIARKIWDWTRAPGEGGKNADSWLDAKGRRIRPGDILVLVRRRNAFVEELVRELKRLDVPVAGVDRMVLPDQLAAMDLAALGRFLLLPEDDLTLAVVLKGPLVGLSEEQLFDLAYDRGKKSLWQALAAKAEADTAYRTAHAQLSDLLARADFEAPHELFAEVLTRDWGGASGRARLLARLGPDANDPIDEFVSLALAYEREHAPSLQGFLHWLEAGRQEVKRDMELGQDAVRVMTVHGAKGLQAPVVILPDTMQTPQPKQNLLWLDEDGDGQSAGLVLWPLRTSLDGPAAASSRAAHRAAQEREYRRLLYVALTRAEDRLYVCGWSMQRAAPEGCWYKLVETALAGVAEPVEFTLGAPEAGGWSGPGWRLHQAQKAAPDKEQLDAESAGGATPDLPDWARRPPPPESAPPRPLAPSRPAQAEPAALSPLGGDNGQRFQRGRLIHRLLQSLPDLVPDRRQTAATRFLAGAAPNLSEAARAEILEATLGVLNHADFAEVFGPDSAAEVPLVGVVDSAEGPQVISGQVDRLCVSDNHVLIVDYKTNRPASADEDHVSVLYIRQLAAYRAVLTKIYPQRRIRCALLWTDGPRLMQLSDALLDRHLP
jgi:ATP-dependent helicase/nuclease subunit A